MVATLPPGAVPRSAPPAAALFGGAPSPQSRDGLDLPPGAHVLPPRPTNPPGHVPQWPTQQQAAPAPQPQYQPPMQPAYPPQQVVQPQQVPATYQPVTQTLSYVPAQQAQYAPQVQQPQVVVQPQPQQQPAYWYTMAPDAQYAAAGQYQFTDGLVLGGRAGGSPAGQLGGTPAQTAPVAGAIAPGVPYTPQISPPVSGQVSTAVRDSLAQQGYAVSHYANDQQLLDDLGQTHQQIDQLRHMARLGWQAQQQTDANTAQPTQPQAQPAAPAAPAKPARPEWKDEWSSYVRKDPQTGRFVPIDGFVNPIVADKANEYLAWQQQRAQQLVSDGLTREELDQHLAERTKTITEQVRQELAREQQVAAGQQLRQQFLESNRQVFFQHDQTGRQLLNPVTGQPVLTPIGQAAFAYADQYAQQFQASYGLEPQPQDVIQNVQMRLAADQARGVFGAPVQPAYQPQQQTPDQLRDQVIQRAAAVRAAMHVPNQAGTIATAAQNATTPQNPQLSFTQQLLQAAEARGQVPQGYAMANR